MDESTFEKELDIMVVNYNTLPYLEGFLKSLINVDVTYSLVIWDNASTDGTSEWLRRNGSGKLCLAHENVGYGRACNLAARIGNARWLLFCNADTQFIAPVMSQWITLAERFDVPISSCKQVNGEGQIIHAGIYGKFPKYSHRGWREVDTGQYAPLLDTSVAYAYGGVVLVRRSVFEELGGFLETPLYYEETWLSRWGKECGYNCGYFGKVKVLHHWSPPSKEASACEQQGRKMYIDMCASKKIGLDYG